MFLKSVGLAAVLAVVIAAPVWGHHSHGNYQMNEYQTMKGTVKEIHWLTPHSWIYIEVKDEKDPKAEPTLWALEGAAVSQLKQRGWTMESIKVGDTISVRCHQLRDGSPGCLLGYVTPPNGQEKIFD